MKIVLSMLIVSAVLIMIGCQANSVEDVPAQPPLTLTPDSRSTPIPILPTQGDIGMTSSPSIPMDTGLQNLIDKAVADLAQRVSIPATQITLVEATAVVWSDASLGCPQPGMAYAQVPEDGLLIRLRAAGQTYEYHSGGTRDPFLCVQTAKEPAPPQIDIFNLTPSQPKSTPGTASAPDNSIPPGESQ